MTQRSVDGDIANSLDSASEGMIKEISESMELDSSRRTARRTLKIANRIYKRPMNILADSWSTNNCVSARECVARKISIERKLDGGEELRLADGSVSKTRGQVQI